MMNVVKFVLNNTVICRSENVYFADTLKELECSQVNVLSKVMMMQKVKLQIGNYLKSISGFK